MSKQKTSRKLSFPQQQFTAIKASTNSPYPSKLGTSEISIESKLQQQMLHNIKATSETTLLNQSFNKCFKPSKLLQKPLYWIKASTNASNHQSYFRNHCIESKLQQMLLHSIKATSESSIRVAVALKIIIVYMHCHSNTETNQAWAIFKALKSDIRSHTHTHTHLCTHKHPHMHTQSHTKIYTQKRTLNMHASALSICNHWRMKEDKELGRLAKENEKTTIIAFTLAFRYMRCST